jgi:hypothetical protein
MNMKMFRSRGAFAPLVLLPIGLASCSGDSGTTGMSSGKSPAKQAAVGTAQQTFAYEQSMDAIEVPPGGELYKCQDFANPFGKDIAITDSKSVMSAGSHHFAAFRIKDLTTAAIMDCPNGGLEAHEFVHASQTLTQETTYPKDVGRFLHATDGLRLQVHYLNTTSDPLSVKATLSMNYVDADSIKYKAGGVFLNNLGLTVPPGKSTQTKSWALTSDIKLLVAVSHMHRHALDFTSSADDGRMLYESQDWDGPTPATFDPPMEIATGTTITWSCTFQNDTGMNLTFGESASANEMCIFNGVYYPAPDDGSSITQNLP